MTKYCLVSLTQAPLVLGSIGWLRTRQRAVTVICTDLPPLLVLLLQIAIDYYAVVLLTVTMNTSCISFLKEHAADLFSIKAKQGNIHF